RHGAQLARIAGIPPRVRDRCNQTRLAFDLRELTNSLDDLRNAGRTLTGDEKAERARLEGIVKGLTAIRDRLVRAAEAGESVLLIDYDTAATGTAIVAFNDPDDSEQVNLHVPGGGTTLAKATSTMRNAENLLREVDRLDGPDGPKTAEIVYIYRTPKLPFGVLRPTHADAAAFDLSRFVHSLHVTHHEDAALYPTITTHSYGTVLLFRAAVLFGVNVVAAAANGAPGSTVETVAQLDIPKIYAGSKENDLLARASTPRIVHNRSPTADEFGAVVFTTDPGKRGLLPGGLSVGAHFDYLATDSLALYNNAQIIRGREPIPALSADALD
ncbi:MAG TPA: alpha/beta hydrolase, partial [Jiangellaceae bacterium]